MPDKPEKPIPDPDELPEEELDLSGEEEPQQIWPPPSGPEGPTVPPSPGLQAGSIDTGWSQEVRKIDETIAEIRRINGQEPEVIGPTPEGAAGAALEREIADIEEEMGAFGSGLAGEVDEEIDEEIVEAIRGETAPAVRMPPPAARPEVPEAAPPAPKRAEKPQGAEPPSVQAAKTTPVPRPAPPAETKPTESELPIDLETAGGEAEEIGEEIEEEIEGEIAEEIEEIEEPEETPKPEQPKPPEPRAAVTPGETARTPVEQIVAGVVESPRRPAEVAAAKTSQATYQVRDKSEAEIGQLWGNIFFSTERTPPRGVIVTAAQRRDGATQIAIALAMVGAEASRERQVILVDLNLRNPGIAEILGIPREPGVTDVLDGRCTLEDAVQALTLKNGNQLHFLPSGPSVDKPLGLVKSRQMQSLVSRLVERYDHTIIDVTAANAHPDPQVLGALVDGALLVVRAGQTPRETAAEAKKRLDLAGVHCLGVVLNQRTDPIPGFLYRMT